MAGDQFIDSIKYKSYKLFWAGVDLLFPPACAGCGNPGTRWCDVCHDSVVRPTQVCNHCGEGGIRGTICSSCENKPPEYTQARAWGVHKKQLRKAIHHLKYKYDLGLAEKFSVALMKITQEMGWDIDMVIAVPLASKRQRERGYNQASLIAVPLAWQLKIPHAPKALRRIRETTTQVGLHREERFANVANAFIAKPSIVAGKTILLIDDVMTSGATMQAASTALKSAGSKDIYVLTVSRPTKIS